MFDAVYLVHLCHKIFVSFFLVIEAYALCFLLPPNIQLARSNRIDAHLKGGVVSNYRVT